MFIYRYYYVQMLHITNNRDSGDYEIEFLAELIDDILGSAGVWVFSLGFVASAVSSMLANPLGSAVASDSMFTEEDKVEESEEEVKVRHLRYIVSFKIHCIFLHTSYHALCTMA